MEVLSWTVKYLGMDAVEEQRLIAHATSRLKVRYPGLADIDIDDAITSARARFDGHKVRDFVPLLVERKAGEALARLVQSEKSWPDW